jgi:hypothetical protein
MTTTDESGRAEANPRSEDATARVIDLLDRLAAAESLGSAAAAAGFSEDEARACLRQAAQIIRKNLGSPIRQRFPLLGSILDWHEMTVAEALEILAEQAASPEPPKADASA